MNIMKKIFFFISLILVFTSCNDQLDLQPYAVVATQTFYNTASDAEAAVTAAYKSFQSLDGQNGTMRAGYHPTGDVLSADVQAHPDIVVYYQMQQSIIRPNSGQVNGLYQRCYVGLLLVNTALEQIPNIEMDATLKARYMGELYFIRGFYMFRLGFVFGTAPVVNKVLALSELNVPNSNRKQEFVSGKNVNRLKITESDLFAQAEADFKMALQQPLANRNTGDLMGRADKGAVRSYLAHVYLYQHKWAEAKAELEQILSYGYGLLPDYNELFDGTHDNSIESVFEIQYTAMNQKSTDSFGTMVYAPNAEGYVTGGGWGWTRPTQDIVSEYEEGDPRLVASVFRLDIDDFYGQVFKDRVNGTGYGFRKFCIAAPPNNKGVTINASNWYTSCNFAMVRYAEVLLWYAEVMNELGDQTTAAQYVNMVRARTATTPNPNTVTPTPIRTMDPISSTLSYEDMFWAIVHERRIELAYEGKFGWDLRRWGIAKKVLRDPVRWQNTVVADYFKYEDGKDEVLPLPQQEIDKSEGVLKQNPGYE